MRHVKLQKIIITNFYTKICFNNNYAIKSVHQEPVYVDREMHENRPVRGGF